MFIALDMDEVMRNTEGREGMLYLVYPAGYPVEGGDEEHRGKGGDAVTGVSCWISSGER